MWPQTIPRAAHHAASAEQTPTAAAMQEEFLLTDFLRHFFICLWVWTFFPAIFVSGSQLLNDGFGHQAALEIRAYRLQQYDFGSKQYGSRSWRVGYEAVSLNQSALRKCVVVHWRELVSPDGAMGGLDSAFGSAVGAVLVVLPKSLDTLSAEDKRCLVEMERQLLAMKTDQAVYFTQESAEASALLASVRHASGGGKASSAWRHIYDTLAGDQYLVTSSPQASSAAPNAMTAKAHNIVAQLNAAERGRPYVLVVAHYDTHSAIPALGHGSDSNGSGVSVLLELMAIFSRVYSAQGAAKPKYNLLFLLSAGGKFSYQGARHWIDNWNDKHGNERVALAICLDGLGGAGDKLYVHNSKTPAEGSSAHNLWRQLENFSPPERPVELATKKINLTAERLAWEHEIFNVRKIHSITLSHFSSPGDRNSILDHYPSSIDFESLQLNTNVIANALLSFLYDLEPSLCGPAKKASEPCRLLDAGGGVQAERLRAWMEVFGAKARPISSAAAIQPLVSNLKEVVGKYADKWELEEVAINDFALYDILEDTLTAQLVKPALFELVLGLFIAVYLYVAYLLASNAQWCLNRLVSRTRPSKKIH